MKIPPIRNDLSTSTTTLPSVPPVDPISTPHAQMHPASSTKSTTMPASTVGQKDHIISSTKPFAWEERPTGGDQVLMSKQYSRRSNNMTQPGYSPPLLFHDMELMFVWDPQDIRTIWTLTTPQRDGTLENCILAHQWLRTIECLQTTEADRMCEVRDHLPYIPLYLNICLQVVRRYVILGTHPPPPHAPIGNKLQSQMYRTQ